MSSCIPFLSQFDDCNDGTECSGCNRCTCNAEGRWYCYRERNRCSPERYDLNLVDDDDMEDAVANLLQEMSQPEEEKEVKSKLIVPLPRKKATTTENPPLEFLNIEEQIDTVLREKRSVGNTDSNNDTNPRIKFYNTVDEINEDTLKNSNVSGTLTATKVDIHYGEASRRNGVLDNSAQSPLHIQYNDPKVYNHHITDNKIDSSHIEDKYNAISHDKIHKVNSNYTFKGKDENLSKIVVSELKRGTEVIGDTKAPIVSNITFTPENDTVTAMAFIAGNLLNKLWNIQKDTTDDSIETEVMKHQKIADLLELFKEPMSYRQERFLKDALEKLSDVLNKNKDIQNISLCETVEEVKDNMNKSDQEKCKRTKNNDDADYDKNIGVVSAISKINNVLSLIKKYEDVQKNLHELKHPRAKPVPRNLESSGLAFTDNEKETLDQFGNILEKITKLLLPNNSNKIRKSIKNHNIFSNNPVISEEIKKKFNINLKDLRLSPKDKLLLDYLTNLQTNPCFSSFKLKEDKLIRNPESDIMLNLSEFFKIKSFSDLLKLVSPEQRKPATETVPSTTTETVMIQRMGTSNFSMEPKDAKKMKTLNLKNKLKIHLKTILNDLIELQNEKGLKSGDINIADVMPCLFNMLSDNKVQRKTRRFSKTELVKKVKSVLDDVKQETKKIMITRRNNVDTGPRPKSAVLWERVVKNLNRKGKQSRRNFNNNEPKSYDEVKKLMDHIAAESSNTYKRFVFLHDVPAAEKLVLLKTLELENKRYINVLEKLQTLNSDGKLPSDRLEDIQEFVDNSLANVNLNEKILDSVDKPKQKRFKVEKNPVEKLPKMKTFAGLSAQSMKQNEENNDSFKLTRDQILNQLIKNRVELYLKIKEAQEDFTEDMKYSIAKRIVLNLENGNTKLAQELFKVFVDNKKQTENNAAPQLRMKPQLKSSSKKPLPQLRKAKPQPWLTQDQLLKQLLNMKSMSE